MRIVKKVNYKLGRWSKGSTLLLTTMLIHLKLKIPGTQLEYTGPLDSWELAEKLSSGWDSPIVVAKVSEATRAVLTGNCSYERDGTQFSTHPVKNTLRELLDELTEKNQQVIDFGGGLGGTYICNSDVLLKKELEYIVIEQQSFVHHGNALAREFSIPIKFSSELPKLESNCIVVFSGVIQYLQHWESVIELISSQEPRYIIVDRIPLEKKESKFFIQENTDYYEPNVSYPCIHLSRQEFLGSFQNYRLIKEWKSDFDPKNHRGFLFEGRKSA